MSDRVVQALSQLFTVLGLALMLGGGAMWWRQSRAEARWLADDRQVVLAVTAEAPGVMPAFAEAEAPRATATEPPPTATLPPETATVLALTPTVPPSPTATATPDPFPPAAAAPTRIIAPAIGLDSAVVEMGWEVKEDANGSPYSEWVVPSNEAGWHLNSALPGYGNNTVVSGHHNVDGEVFRYVVDLDPGDEVRLQSGGRWYRYVVEEKYIVKEKGEPLDVRIQNNRYIEPTDDERLTLVSCWPYETNTHRVVVIARPRAADEPSGATP